MDTPGPVTREITRYAARFPIPSGPHGDAKDRAGRAWVGGLASHLAHKFGPQWGGKRAAHGRPRSKDSVAFQSERILYGFDLLDGLGTDNTRLVIPARGKNLTDPLPENEHFGDQVFIAAGDGDGEDHIPPARDWLDGTVPGPVDPPPVDPPVDPPIDPQPPTNGDIVARLHRLEAKVDQILATLAQPFKLEA